MHRLVLSFVLGVILTPDLSAQSTGNTESATHVSPALGIHYGSPMRISVSAGFLADLSEGRDAGIVAVAEVGQQGDEISAGYFRMLGKFGAGYSLRAAVVRTTDDPWNASPKTTYVGGEGHLMIAFGVGARIGYLRRVSRSVLDPNENLASIGISIGI